MTSNRQAPAPNISSRSISTPRRGRRVSKAIARMTASVRTTVMPCHEARSALSVSPGAPRQSAASVVTVCSRGCGGGTRVSGGEYTSRNGSRGGGSVQAVAAKRTAAGKPTAAA